MGIPITVEERLDTLSLARQIKNIGRAYQSQAIELVNLCRMFVKTFPPEKRQNAMPKLTMLAIFEALRLAEIAGKKATDNASAAFQEAKVELLRYRAIVHPGLQSMDATIAEGMARAKEKDERFLGLFNKLLERRGPNETSALPNANARIRMGHADRRVHTKAQVASSHTAVVPVGASHAPSASPLIHVLFMTHIKVEEGRCSSIDHRYTPSSPHALIHRASLASISRKRPSAGSCSTTTTTPIAPAPGASESLKAPPRRSSSSIVTPAIQESSFEVAGPRGIQPLIVQERPENVSIPPTGIPQHLLVPPSSHSPLTPQSTRTDPPPNAIDVAPTVSSERQKGTTQRSSNSLPRSEEKKVSPIHSQTKIKSSTRTSITQKPSAKFASFSLTPNKPGPETQKEAPSHLMMPGAFPRTSLDDVDNMDNVDMSSWVLVSPADCQVEVSKRSWFKRMFSRFG